MVMVDVLGVLVRLTSTYTRNIIVLPYGIFVLLCESSILYDYEVYVHVTFIRRSTGNYSFGDRVASERGCCVLVRSPLHTRVIGTPHPCWTCARVGGDGSNDSAGIIFISVYLPTGSQGEPYRCRLREELAQLREKFPRDTVVGSEGLEPR
jgi:hypothetical protein